MIRPYAYAVVAALLFIGCVTPTVVKPPEGTVDFKKYRTLRVAMHDRVNGPYSKESIPILDRMVKEKLRSMGYSIVDAGEDMALELNVTRFEPGSAAVRFFIGFGAGRALLTFQASFREKSGALIAEFEGGKSYTGMEISDNPLFYGEAQIKMGMIEKAVNQIGQFIRNNGRFE